MNNIFMHDHEGTLSTIQKVAKSSHLIELQKEIKEEEEEIFADINSLINGGSCFYSSLVGDLEDECGQENEYQFGKEKSLFYHQQLNQNQKQQHQQYQQQQQQQHQQLLPHHNSTFKLCSSLHQDSNSNGSSNQLSDCNYSLSRDSVRLFNSNTSDNEDQNDYQSHSADDLNLHEHHHFRHHHHNISTTLANNQSGSSSSSIGSSSRILLQNSAITNDEQAHDSGPYNNSAEQQYLQNTNHQQDDDNLYSSDDLQQEQQLTHEEEEDELANDQNIEEGHYVDDSLLGPINQQDYQAIIQQVTSNLPKPCVFFLEGNCRRSDCKYSHDLSNITCKYWIEGFCFKGELCPFLHSYNSSDLHDPNSSDEDAIKFLSKQQLNPTFVIESEADFPSLPLDAPIAALNDSSKSGIETDNITTTIKNQILSSNTAVVFKTIKKKRKRG